MINCDLLVKKAYEGRANAYTPYSNFKVGAAVLTEDDTIYTGCNIENASYGATNCAEGTGYVLFLKVIKKLKLSPLLV